MIFRGTRKVYVNDFTIGLGQTDIDAYESVFDDLVSFYVQTFFEHSGRAPIVPHAVPF